MPRHKWQFAPRFRRHAFGWRSDTPIKRIKEAVSEIKQVARKEPALAAEGAVIFLEKLSPAIEQVDGSSGAIGSAVHRAIETLVPIIAQAAAEPSLRQEWLERLWHAVQEDDMPYIEDLADYWGELCGSPSMASSWADEFLSIVKLIWSKEAFRRDYFKGTDACFSALYAAGRHGEILALLEQAPSRWWYSRRWGVNALAAMGRPKEAVQLAEARELNDPAWQIAESCEAILLSSGNVEEAYRRYALEANPGTTHLARFRAIARKYPQKAKADILRDLIASTPGEEGKWFAAAKDAGLFDVAIALVESSPADPRTLNRAARDFAEKKPEFALACGMAALKWITRGYGHEITNFDVLDAYDAIVRAASASGIQTPAVNEDILQLIARHRPDSDFVMRSLRPRLMR